MLDNSKHENSRRTFIKNSVLMGIILVAGIVTLGSVPGIKAGLLSTSTGKVSFVEVQVLRNPKDDLVEYRYDFKVSGESGKRIRQSPIIAEESRKLGLPVNGAVASESGGFVGVYVSRELSNSEVDAITSLLTNLSNA